MPASLPLAARRHLTALGGLSAAALALTGCSTMGSIPTERVGSGQLMLSNGAPAGTVQLLGAGDSLELTIVATGLPSGTHGFHLHQTGRCERPDFQSAGGHLNPLNREHGLENPAGPHFGDLRNLEIPASGTITRTVTLRGTRAEALSYIFDADGTAVMIHAGADDYVSDPAGDAGGRIACAVLTRSS